MEGRQVWVASQAPGKHPGLLCKRTVEGMVRTWEAEAESSKDVFQECLEREISVVNYILH